MHCKCYQEMFSIWFFRYSAFIVVALFGCHLILLFYCSSSYSYCLLGRSNCLINVTIPLAIGPLFQHSIASPASSLLVLLLFTFPPFSTDSFTTWLHCYVFQLGQYFLLMLILLSDIYCCGMQSQVVHEIINLVPASPINPLLSTGLLKQFPLRVCFTTTPHLPR